VIPEEEGQPQPATAGIIRRDSAAANRLVTIFVAVSAILNVILIILVVLLGLSNRSTIANQHSDTISSCQTANGNRSEDSAILNQILALPAIAHPQFITKASMQQQNTDVALIKAHIKTGYAAHNCAAQYSGK
jgi:hypothetical protein